MTPKTLTINGCADLFAPEQVDDSTWVVLPPIYQADGDSIPIFLHAREDHWVLSDHGAVAAELANDGQRYWEGTRAEIMRAVATQGESKITEHWEIERHLDDHPTPAHLLAFLQVLIRAGDVGFLERRQVQQTFREDLQRRLLERVRSDQIVTAYVDPLDVHGDLKVDVLLQPEERPPVVVQAAWDVHSASTASIVLSTMRAWHGDWKLVVADGGMPKKRARQLAYVADDHWDAVDLRMLDQQLEAVGVAAR